MSQPRARHSKLYKIVDAQAIDSTVTSSRLDMTGYNQLTVFVEHTNSSATAVTNTVRISTDGGTTWFPIQSASIASGTATLSDLTYSKTVSADDEWMFEFPVNYHDPLLLDMQFDGTSADSSDTITVYAMKGLI